MFKKPVYLYACTSAEISLQCLSTLFWFFLELEHNAGTPLACGDSLQNHRNTRSPNPEEHLSPPSTTSSRNLSHRYLPRLLSSANKLTLAERSAEPLFRQTVAIMLHGSR
ncbi:hypothetical protein CC2G_010285 [Coprinopsis cinerea AmutBmut pab1-1]|nr:hypothetical protein CC2G_010285 [Coprinopsis cinerea AmutBmut pab1-1]